MDTDTNNKRPDLEAASHQNPRASLSSDCTVGEEDKGANFSASKKPHKPFPPVITGHQTGARIESFLLCGETKSDALFKVNVHMGYSARGPLGTRPGLYLHNGTSVKDPILAAAGDESQWSARVYAFNNKSLVMLPRMPGDESGGTGGYKDWVTETMVGSTTGTDDSGVVFRFAVNRGRDDGGFLTRERFEWRKFKKGTDPEHPTGGYKLFRLPRPTNAATTANCLAVWEPGKGLSKYWDHMFTLRFVGEAVSELGEEVPDCGCRDCG